MMSNIKDTLFISIGGRSRGQGGNKQLTEKRKLSHVTGHYNKLQHKDTGQDPTSALDHFMESITISPAWVLNLQ